MAKSNRRGLVKEAAGAPRGQRALLPARQRVVLWVLGRLGITPKSPEYTADVAVRAMIAVVALVGVGITAYLTYVGFSGAEVVCTSSDTGGDSSCGGALNSAWADVGGVPLALFGLIAYFVTFALAIAPLVVQRVSADGQNYQQTIFYTAMALVFVTTSMAIFSIYLMFGQWFRLDLVGTCIFCLSSAIVAITLAVLSGGITEWRSLTAPAGTATVALALTLVVSLAGFTVPETVDGRQVVNAPLGTPDAGVGWDIRTDSGAAEIELAEFLIDNEAIMYGAWWCPHCHIQKELFGEEAFKLFEQPENLLAGSGYVECQTEARTVTQLCAQLNIQGYPTWFVTNAVTGEPTVLGGSQNLEVLAEAAGYTGNTDFNFISNQ